MALFSVREAWRGPSAGADEYDARGMCTCQFAYAGDGDVRVVTGSLGGLLRILRPRQRAYSVEDLELEAQLEQPVLQVAGGRFVSQSPGETALAVLHPTSLVVYSVLKHEAGFVALEKRYSHQLGTNGEHFSAANMVVGPFGGVRDRDFVAVQSLDGQLQVFEQESFAFIRQLNDVLLPGPMAYLQKLDCVLVSNSQFQVDCYKYQTLAASTSRVARQGGRPDLVQTEWSFTVGEQILDVTVTRVSSGLAASNVDVCVLAERSIYCLSERGEVRTHIKLEVGCNPLCCASLPVLSKDPSGKGLTEPLTSVRNLMVCSESGSLSILKGFKLAWSASMKQHVPAALGVARVEGVEGMIVSMSDDGLVCVSYLGTEPTETVLMPRRQKKINQAGTLRNKENESKENRGTPGEDEPLESELDHEELDREYRRLSEKIRNLHREMEAGRGGGGGGDMDGSDEPLLVRVQVPDTLDELSVHDNMLAVSDDPDRLYSYYDEDKVVQVTVKVFLSNKGRRALKNLQVSLCLPPPFMGAETAFQVPMLEVGARDGRALTPTILTVPVRVKNDVCPSSLEASVLCMYKGPRGAVRHVQTGLRLPLFVAARLRPAVKNSAAKITIDTDCDPVRLSVLFDDMMRQPGLGADLVESVSGASSNVVSLDYFSGSNVTVLASKNAGRYRIQGSCLGHLWVMADELVRRLQAKFGADGIKISYQDPIPLDALGAAIDKHHGCRLAHRKVSSQLNDRAHMYRVVQKRLLARFKDKNAPPLQGLDSLLQATHDKLIKSIDGLAHEKMRLQTLSAELSAALRLVLLLSELKFQQLEADDLQVLEAHLSPEVSVCDTSQAGWEEMADLAITHLLRTTLAKQPKAVAPASGAPPRLTLSADASKLKKHIAMLFDRLERGARPSAQGLAAAESAAAPKSDESKE